jgi:ABC-type glycerol-3-phosphate transport system substrate-binding protein
MKKILALVMVLGVLGGVLVGCGGPAADANATSSATTNTEPAK